MFKTKKTANHKKQVFLFLSTLVLESGDIEVTDLGRYRPNVTVSADFTPLRQKLYCCNPYETLPVLDIVLSCA